MGKIAENYTEASVRSLDWKEHIRMRPGMYIGKLGDGASQDDGIYVLIKEIIDNSIDEFVMGNGKIIEVDVDEKQVRIRDYGRGIPLGSVVDCVSKINTGAKYDSKVFKKAVGLNGVGSKAVNALSSNFIIQSVRDGKTKLVEFKRGEILRNEHVRKETHEKDGTTSLHGPIPDQAALHSILRKIRDLNLQLISVKQVNSDAQNEPHAYSEGGVDADNFHPNKSHFTKN